MATPFRTLDKHRTPHPARSRLLPWIELADAIVAASREYGSRLLDSLQSRLETWRLRIDPATERWIAEAHKSIADGSIDERIRSQPTPEALAAELKQARRKG